MGATMANSEIGLLTRYLLFAICYLLFARSRLPSGGPDVKRRRVSQQQTLRQSVRYSGIGLHSGNRVTMTLQPAPPGGEIRFRRMDREGKPEIEARIENVAQTNRSTTLAKGNAKVQTVEHVL